MQGSLHWRLWENTSRGQKIRYLGYFASRMSPLICSGNHFLDNQRSFQNFLSFFVTFASSESVVITVFATECGHNSENILEIIFEHSDGNCHLSCQDDRRISELAVLMTS